MCDFKNCKRAITVQLPFIQRSLNRTNESLALAFCLNHRDFLNILYNSYKYIEISIGNDILINGMMKCTPTEKFEIFNKLMEIIRLRELFYSYLKPKAKDKYKHSEWIMHLYKLLFLPSSRL